MKYLCLLVLLWGMVSGQSKVGVFTTIIDSPVDQVFWCGGSLVVTSDDDMVDMEQKENETHRKVIFVLSNRGILYRSIDYGYKWENVTDNLINKHNLTNDSPADSHILYLMGQSGRSFKTDDCGRYYQAFNHSSKMYGFRMNKMNKNHMLAFEERPCNKTVKSCRDQYKRVLYVTKDGGLSWDAVKEHVRDAAWDKLVHYEMIPDTRIIITHIDDKGQLLVSYSDDFFKTTKLIDKDSFGFYQTPSYLFLLVRPDPLSTGYDLKMSQPVGNSYFPQEIVLPIDDQSKHTFTVLDVYDGQVFLSVAHQEDLSKLTNIYMSDGSQFTVSLLGNVRSQDTGHCDFERIKSVEGVYIANVYDHQEVEKLRVRRKRINEEKEYKHKQADRLDTYRRSVITFDKGAQWHQIKAPKYDYNGQPLRCSGDCSLHLRGRTEAPANQIYSSEQGVGIIVATGNTGLYLTQKDEEINTYLSRDGGHNWFEILQGSHTYEIGDHGGLIVIAQDDRKIDALKFTWDEGLTFEDIQLNGTIEVDNIVTEPSNMEQKFLIYGRMESKIEDPESIFSKYDKLKGVLVSLDFTFVHQRVCTGQWDPTMPESDYEYWMPMNFIEQKCLFGRRMKFLRRKRNAKCFNPEDQERKIIEERCACTEEDWECDMGYYRKIDGGECIRMTEAFKSATEYNQVPKECKGTYTKSQGYRKIPNDQCEGGVDLGPIEVPCPEQENNDKAENIETPKSNKETNKHNNNPKTVETPTNYKDILIVAATLICIVLFREQLLAVFYAIRDATRTKQRVEKKNYYPLTSEELQERQKKQHNQYEMRDDDDDEAGL